MCVCRRLSHHREPSSPSTPAFDQGELAPGLWLFVSPARGSVLKFRPKPWRELESNTASGAEQTWPVHKSEREQKVQRKKGRDAAPEALAKRRMLNQTPLRVQDLPPEGDSADRPPGQGPERVVSASCGHVPIRRTWLTAARRYAGHQVLMLRRAGTVYCTSYLVSGAAAGIPRFRPALH